jgi:ribosomal protein L36
MTYLLTDSYHWTESCLYEIILPDPDAFLKIKETLSRIGLASKKEKILCQTCHILHRRGRYYIMNFKELFALDGSPTAMEYSDIARRNTITNLLEQWGLCKIVKKSELILPTNSIKIIPFSQKAQWQLVAKYTIGKKVQWKK